jgi:hypothetical protein
MGKAVKNPEATKVSDEEYLEANWTSAVGSISAGNAKYAAVLRKQDSRWLPDSNLDTLS